MDKALLNFKYLGLFYMKCEKAIAVVSNVNMDAA